MDGLSCALNGRVSLEEYERRQDVLADEFVKLNIADVVQDTGAAM